MGGYSEFVELSELRSLSQNELSAICEKYDFDVSDRVRLGPDGNCVEVSGKGVYFTSVKGAVLYNVFAPRLK